jgi:hypothetical protein
VHWGVLEGSDEAFEEVLIRLNRALAEDHGTEGNAQTHLLRRLLLRADHYTDNPVTSAIRAHAAVKVS